LNRKFVVSTAPRLDESGFKSRQGRKIFTSPKSI